MVTIFFDPVNSVNFWISGLFSLLYMLVNLLGMRRIFGEGMRVANRMSNVYAFALSIPVMPFMLHPVIIVPFVFKVLAIFALSYFIWQMIYIISAHQVSAVNIIISVSWVNLVALVVVGLVNFFFYSKLAQAIAQWYIA